MVDQQLGELVVRARTGPRNDCPGASPIVQFPGRNSNTSTTPAHKDLASESRSLQYPPLLVKRSVAPALFAFNQLASWMNPVVVTHSSSKLGPKVRANRIFYARHRIAHLAGCQRERAPSNGAAGSRPPSAVVLLRRAGRQSKLLLPPRCRQHAEVHDSLHFFFETHWDHEPGRVAFVRAPRSVTARTLARPFPGCSVGKIVSG